MRRTAIAAAVAATVAALTACADDPAAPPARSPAPASAAASVDTRTPEQRAEDTFVAVTAAHLCVVQSTVYEDPKAMAAAYDSIPDYPGLTAPQVDQFRKRMTSDQAFADRVTEKLQQTCTPGTPRPSHG
ncbi:hypothetical protein [Actinoplanes sp. NPDC049118]|uniref:hypothetical protein n=1 Tax=Actinoplanes sp. NPDC049118 TaxID=3155769 RepID=UPI0033FF7C56